jgi:hypothetical protein
VAILVLEGIAWSCLTSSLLILGRLASQIHTTEKVHGTSENLEEGKASLCNFGDESVKGGHSPS